MQPLLAYSFQEEQYLGIKRSAGSERLVPGERRTKLISLTLDTFFPPRLALGAKDLTQRARLVALRFQDEAKGA